MPYTDLRGGCVDFITRFLLAEDNANQRMANAAGVPLGGRRISERRIGERSLFAWRIGE